VIFFSLSSKGHFFAENQRQVSIRNN